MCLKIYIFIAPPIWKISPVDVEAVNDESVILNCYGSGKPEPTVTWMRMTSNITIYNVYFMNMYFTKLRKRLLKNLMPHTVTNRFHY